MAKKRAAYHLGRHGDVAGGMTQVVNDYLTWSFPQFSHFVIVTRGSKGRPNLHLFFRALSRVRALDAVQQPVVVAHLSQGGSFLREGLVAAYAHRRGLAVVAQLHGSSFPEFARKHPHVTRWVLNRAHAIHVLSSETAAAVAALRIEVPAEVIPNAVSDGPTAEKRNLVVFGGAVTRRKGVDVLVAAWESLQDRGNWELLVVGPHSEPDIVAHPSRGVSAPGQLTRDELRALLAAARIAVLPSVDEAMPLFILEALASDAAVIATPVGGIPSVITSAIGVLVPPGDVESLRAALALLMSEPDHRQSLVEAGRQAWEARYSPRVVVPQLEELWMRAVERSRRLP